MLRFIDEIQIDRAYHRAKRIILAHQEEIAKLREENTRLTNRPEAELPPDIVKTSKMKVVVGEKHLQDPIEAWKTGHFIRYFEHKFVAKYKEVFPLRDSDWKLYSIRIKMFRDQNAYAGIQDNAAFKRYIDWCFDSKFNKRFVASIYAMASQKLLTDFRIDVGASQRPASYEELMTKMPKTKGVAREKLIKDAF